MAEYIEREALKQKIVDEQTENRMNNHPDAYKIGYHNGLTMAIAMVIHSPAADVAPVVHGRWREADDGDGAVCSVCGEDFCNIYLEVDRFKCCPNCGARMDGE